MNFNTAITGEKYMETGYAEDVQRPTKKPGFLSRWLMKKLVQGTDFERRQNQERASITSRLSTIEKHSLGSQPMHLKIYRANGGTIVETTTYDRQKDRHGNQLHIISHDTDLGEGLSKIITMESLRG